MLVGASWKVVRSLLLAGLTTLPFLTACGSESPPAPPQTQRVRIFLISREDGGRNGILIPCNDSAVPVTVMVPAGERPLQSALRVLFNLDPSALRGSSLMHPLLHSKLSLVSVDIDEARAEIRLAGQLRAATWPCNRDRIRAQLEQTALQFDEIRQVEMYVNGRPLSELLGPSRDPSSPQTPGGNAPGPSSEPPASMSGIPPGAGEPVERPAQPFGQR